MNILCKLQGLSFLLVSFSIRNFLFSNLGLEEFNTILFFVCFLSATLMIFINSSFVGIRYTKAKTDNKNFIYYLVSVISILWIAYYFYQTYTYINYKVIMFGILLFFITTIGLSLLLLPQEMELANER